MLKNDDYNQNAFPTIDDAFSRVEEGYLVLRRLRALKYPLAVRRGIHTRSRTMASADKSRVLRAKGRTYFFDIKKSSEGKPYAIITESRLRRGDQPPYLARIALFPEDAQAFLGILEEVVALVRQE
jgi:hypothetical protein